MRILLALSDTDRAAADLAWLAGFTSGLVQRPELVALHVVPLRTEGVMGVMEEYATADLADARTRIDAAVPPGLAVELRLQAGSPGPVICEEARGFDLVVVGAGTRSQLGELVVGSTSAYVTHHAPCAVLMLPRPELGR